MRVKWLDPPKTYIILRVVVGAVLQEQDTHLDVCKVRSVVERCVAILVANIREMSIGKSGHWGGRRGGRGVEGIRDWLGGVSLEQCSMAVRRSSESNTP